MHARGQHQRHATGDGRVALAGADALAREVQCHQRRRARGVDRHGGPGEVEQISDPRGQHRAGVAEEGVRAVALLLLPQQIEVVAGGAPDEHAPAPLVRPVDRVPGVLQAGPCGLQEQPLLRVHRRGLQRRDPEELSIESVHSGQ